MPGQEIPEQSPSPHGGEQGFEELEEEGEEDDGEVAEEEAEDEEGHEERDGLPAQRRSSRFALWGGPVRDEPESSVAGLEQSPALEPVKSKAVWAILHRLGISERRGRQAPGVVEVGTGDTAGELDGPQPMEPVKMTDMEECLSILWNAGRYGESACHFFYALPTDSPYDLELAPMERTSRSALPARWVMVSAQGMTFHYEDEDHIEFLPFDKWLAERRQYLKLRRLRTFREHLPRKTFGSWKQGAAMSCIDRAASSFRGRYLLRDPRYQHVMLWLQLLCLRRLRTLVVWRGASSGLEGGASAAEEAQYGAKDPRSLRTFKDLHHRLRAHAGGGAAQRRVRGGRGSARTCMGEGNRMSSEMRARRV